LDAEWPDTRTSDETALFAIPLRRSLRERGIETDQIFVNQGRTKRENRKRDGPDREREVEPKPPNLQIEGRRDGNRIESGGSEVLTLGEDEEARGEESQGIRWASKWGRNVGR